MGLLSTKTYAWMTDKQMQTECRSEKLEFQASAGRPIMAVNGGTIISDGGVYC